MPAVFYSIHDSWTVTTVHRCDAPGASCVVIIIISHIISTTAQQNLSMSTSSTRSACSFI